MPPMELAYRMQRAVLWEKTGVDEYGVVQVDARVEMCVRWVNKKQEFLQPDGSTISVDATVVVCRDVSDNSLMWEGGEEDIPGTSFIPEEDIYQVVTRNIAKDMKGRVVRRTLGLVRFNDTLPTLGG